MLAYVRSDIGLVRDTNEDSYAFIPPHLFIVADGMGGHAAGEIASRLAIATISEYVIDNANSASPDLVLEQAIIQANDLIYKKSRSEVHYAGMGTTVTATYVEGSNIYWAHVGDSRIYMLPKSSNEICQLTQDHSLVWELMRNGNISKEEAHIHPQRNVLTRAVGTGSQIKIDIGSTAWTTGDVLLLCTDGLTNMVSEHDICRLIKTNGISESTIDLLVDEAKTAGGLDNITAILLHHGD